MKGSESTLPQKPQRYLKWGLRIWLPLTSNVTGSPAEVVAC